LSYYDVATIVLNKKNRRYRNLDIFACV